MAAFWDRFFFRYRLSDGHLSLFRVVFFFLVALDCWLQISHAPRYGAGDFNVGHFPFLEGVMGMPGRHLMAVLYTTQAYLALMLAFGRAERPALILLTALFGYSYFVSQLNSYQHEWMMFVVLCALCFTSWQPRERETLANGDWPIRLVLVIVSIVYMWAVITKVDPLWLNGKTVSLQIKPTWAREIFERFLSVRSPDPLAPWARFAVLVMVIEGLLAVAIHIRRLRWPTFLVGVLFHLGIEAIGFKIGLFSYYMAGLYLLILPIDDIERWCGKWFEALPRPGPLPELDRMKARIAFAVACAVGVALLGLLVPIERSWYLAIVVAAAAGFVFFIGERAGSSATRLLISHSIACLLLVSFAHTTDTIIDYHRFWGGSSRRLGNTESAERAYSRLVEIAPSRLHGHLGLSRVYLKSDPERALKHCESIKEIAANDFRGFVCAAQIHQRAGRLQQALENARTANALDPENKTARRILDQLRRVQ